jgi:hypothetical protein
LSAPSSIIAGQSGGGRFHLQDWHHREGRHNLDSEAHRNLLVVGKQIQIGKQTYIRPTKPCIDLRSNSPQRMVHDACVVRYVDLVLSTFGDNHDTCDELFSL